MKGKIVLFGRQNNSGTYDYFREHICGKNGWQAARVPRRHQRDERLLRSRRERREDPLTLWATAAWATRRPTVNWLKVSNKKGEPGRRARDRGRAQRQVSDLAQALHLHRGRADRRIKAYIDWILSPAGQKIVEKEGFVQPLH